MSRERVEITVQVDLDPVPGTFHTAEDAQRQVGRILSDAIPHYNPQVMLGSHGNACCACSSPSVDKVWDGAYKKPVCAQHREKFVRSGEATPDFRCSFALGRGDYCRLWYRHDGDHDPLTETSKK